MAELHRETYRVRGDTWEILERGVYFLSKNFSCVTQDGDPEFSRSLALNETAYANIAVYPDKERIKIFYFGINEKEGKKLVEEEIGVRLRKTKSLENHFTRTELKQLHEVSARRKSCPREI